jgi:hypothetical protein
VVKRASQDPLWNWDLPDVEVPDDPGCPVLSAEQWVVWFRTQPTWTQVRIAQSVMDLQAGSEQQALMNYEGRAGRAEDTVQSLRESLGAIKDSLRSILEDTKGVRPQKKRAAMLAERITAIGVAIKEMRL